MQYFSEEYKDKLVNEHKLLTGSINFMQHPGNYAKYVRTHGVDLASAALNDMRIKKVQLEAKIDTLIEFLDG